MIRSGGRVGLANWTPEGFVGQLFQVVGAPILPPAGLKSPTLWGTEPYIVGLFGKDAVEIQATRKLFSFRYRSAATGIQEFRDVYGPAHRAFRALDPAGQDALEQNVVMVEK